MCTITLREVIGENTGWLVKFKLQIKVFSKYIPNTAWDILIPRKSVYLKLKLTGRLFFPPPSGNSILKETPQIQEDLGAWSKTFLILDFPTTSLI